ncbi:MAG TPA: HypC/HybG/HupF family hydrogenase formation chaperone [Lachnospiraceae bacterium]|nr:HypC/HybG/HupF family hydrogenase formation chaperone [Lachnospiraceae bacterium]
MCVGLSARIVKINENGTALVDASGAKRQISAQLLEDLEPGDYVMVHAGAAIAKITNDDISETDQLLEEFL